MCERLKRKENLIGIILYGSLAKGNFHNFSDVDLYVVGKEEKERVSSIYVEDVPVQILWRSIEQFEQKMQKINREHPISKHGRILYDPTGFIKEYFAEINSKVKFPKPLSKNEKLLLQATLSQDLDIIKGLLEKGRVAEAIILMNDFTVEAINAYYDVQKLWMPGKKHIITDFKQQNLEYGEIAEQVILASFPSKKLSHLERLRDKILDLMGGELREYEIYFDEE